MIHHNQHHSSVGLDAVVNPNRRVAAPVCCALLLGLVVKGGCNSSSDPTTDTGRPTNDGKPRIALIMKSLANEFFSTMADGARQHQQGNAEQFDLIVNGIKDERDISRQVALVEEMVASGVDAIVIAPADSKALVTALRRAKDDGVVVVNIDNRLDAEVLRQQDIRIPFVGPDNQAGAYMVGEFLAGKLRSGDRVLILEGIRTSFNGQQRLIGFEKAMKAANIEIADSQSAQWEMSKANTIASSMLSEHPDASAILCANDNMALGAIAAIKSAGKSDGVLVVGFDNISAIQAAIRDGKILATADQHGDQLAVFGIQAALKILADPEITPEDVQTDVDLITRESLMK
ncbi:MAG: sugar ABC transporter substrate-binding protein [Planctomycetota bacterium]